MSTINWSEQASQTFIDYGRYFVPERELQIEAFCDLIPARDRPFNILELCCGEGLLAGALLERFPASVVYGFDGSPAMLEHARQQLAPYGERFQTRLFDLADRSWRALEQPIHAVVSSLTIHHLDREGKQQLFEDMARLLEPGGVFLIADVIEPASRAGAALAAKAWDAAVRQRALEIDGNLDALAYFERERWNMYRYPDLDDIDKPSRLLDQLKWLEEAGFTEVDVFWMKAGHVLFGGQKNS
ncbi:MAG TPA: methyltransferase domain-containing protein [Roseiflexaceae bacterium]|nr:methyltransferase domain-containing protein [Roseiflexaceae bacterium]